MAPTSINCLAAVLKELRWSYGKLIVELRRHAAIDGIVLPKTESLVPLISRWVNNHQQPDHFYRELLSRATGRQRFELFSDEAAVVLQVATEDSGIARSVAVNSDEDMNRRQLSCQSRYPQCRPGRGANRFGAWQVSVSRGRNARCFFPIPRGTPHQGGRASR